MWTQFPLHTDTPEDGGTALADLFAGRGFDLTAAHARLARLMDAEGLRFVARDRTYNSRLAQELGKWAEGQGATGIHDALFLAYFAEGVDISRRDDLVRIAAAQGLDAGEARRVLEERVLGPAVDADWRRARELGVTGVPTFVAGGAGVVGAQPYEALEQLVVRAGAARRA